MYGCDGCNGLPHVGVVREAGEDDLAARTVVEVDAVLEVAAGTVGLSLRIADRKGDLLRIYINAKNAAQRAQLNRHW